MKLIDYDVKYLLNSSHVNTDRTLKLACATDSELIIPAGKSTKSSAANIKVQVSPAEYWYIFNGAHTYTNEVRRALHLLFASVKMARKIFHAIPPHIFRESFRESYPLVHGPRRLSIFLRKSAEVNGPLIDRFGFDGSTCSDRVGGGLLIETEERNGRGGGGRQGTR